MFSDERLNEAAESLCFALAQSFSPPEEYRHDFSPEFTFRMERLIRKNRHSGRNRAMGRAAGVLLAVLLGSGIWLMMDAEVRAGFFGWVGEKIDSVQHYFFEGQEASEVPDTSYHLNELPDGYHEDGIFKTEDSVDITYVNDAGQYLSFGYIFRPTEYSATEIAFLEMDKMEKEILQIDGSSAECFTDPTGDIGNVIVWQDAKAETLLYISGYFDQEELIRMAENVIREE